MIEEHVKLVLAKKVDVVKLTKEVLAIVKKLDKEYKVYAEISEDLALSQARALAKNPKGRFAGVFVSVKDGICVEDVQSRASSKILEGYKPPFSATAVQNLIEEGAIIIGKTVQDEFGFGGFCTNVGLGFDIPLNPLDKTRSVGGSSGGSAAITALASFPHIALGESTGGSIVNPASFCGVIGLCPTYGRVSRYGLIDYANSLDKIGPIAKNAKDAALALEVISGYDKKDSTSSKEKVPIYSNLKKDVTGLRVGIIKEAFGDDVSKVVKDSINKKIDELKKLGAKVEVVSLKKNIEYGIPAYYILATSEASTNLAKYCGMRYGATEKLEGSFNEYFSNIRSKNFGEEAKRRIILGTFARTSGYRDAYYIKAMKVRTIIIEEYKKAFEKYDVLISPTTPMTSPKFSEISKMTPLQHYMADVLTVGPNLAGLPHINIPIKTKDMPVGLMGISNHFEEGVLLSLAEVLTK
ncbi:Asp-tRNA(Asn)/Glu-tRNA(Gln) amidotransferase subunit GatA [Candidatus Woesearchaeota archaeon]|nr:Asp-tRNA(Asn)/Glu-tRNA(Gln) amidotransferase subunit GatA [Candidatus Woesearchaeota archaeon]